MEPIQPRLAPLRGTPLAPIRTVPSASETPTSHSASVMDELSAPTPRRRLRRPDEILRESEGNRDEEQAEAEESAESEETKGREDDESDIEDISDTAPVTSSVSYNPRPKSDRRPGPIDVRQALGIPKAASTEQKTAFPFDDKPASNILSPIRSPQSIWDSTSSRSGDPLSPTGSSSSEMKPRRRLSQWLAEDIDMKMVAEKEEKKRHLERQLSRQQSISQEEAAAPELGSRRGSLADEPNELIKAAQKEIQQRHRSQHRRESIKVHLQRIRQKAEKVLEEVHDRFTEEHSSSSVAPTDDLLKSPTATTAPPSEGLPDEERITSPTPSVASKRTTNSAESKDKLRTMLRKQAEKVVERTRGSVHLTKRLQRRQTVITEEGPTLEEIVNVDEHIENSIKLGAKYTEEKQRVTHAQDVQFAFFANQYEKPREELTAMVEYRPAIPCREPPEEMFTVIESEERQPTSTDDVEAGASAPPILQCSMDISKMEKRVGRSLLDGNGNLKTISHLITDKPLKYIPWQDDAPVAYCGPIPWTEFAQSGSGAKFVQLDIDIGELQFNHHWLAGEEDAIAMRIRSLCADQIETAQRISDGMREISLMQQENELTGEKLDLDPLISEVDVVHAHFNGITSAIAKEYHQLKEIREITKVSTSSIRLKKIEQNSQNEDDLFNLNGLFLLSDDHPITQMEQLPTEMKERRTAIGKCQLQVAIHFNGIPVYRTPARTLTQDFSVNFNEVYNLEIYSMPESITLTVSERMGTKGEWNQLAVVGVPLPDEHSFTEEDVPRERMQFACPRRYERFRGSLGAGIGDSPMINGYVTCRATWSKKGEMKLRYEENLFHQRKASVANQPFHLIPPCARLVSDEEFDSDLRLDVLALRFQRKLWNNPAYKKIPLDSADVDASLLLTDDRRTNIESNYRSGIDGHRLRGIRYATMLRSQLIERFTRSEREKTYSDMVREEPIPTLFGAFGSLFAPVDTSRKLKPQRKTQRVLNAAATSSTLIINIQSATNLPLRADGSVQTFVQVTFQGTTSQTTVVPGRSPTWQQTVSIPVQKTSEEDADLKTITDFIEISIYDQIVSPLAHDSREVNTLHEQVLRRFLGSAKIPFSCVFCRGKIDGHIRIQTPIFLTSYTLADLPVFLKVLIALDPVMNPPALLPPMLNGTIETETLFNQCESWQKQCRSQHEKRRYVAVVSDSNARKILACRYLRGIRLPPAVQVLSGDRRSAAELACRIVSYIPFLSDPLLFPGVSDVWTTVDQFLSLGCGDEEEHAVLLACWLISLGIVVCIVLGNALPEGDKAAYVLAHFDNIALLMNPTDGNVYSLDDSMCPLSSVGTVVTQNNVYGNIQQSAHPSQIQWDFKKINNWRPLFERERDPLPSIQPELIDYHEISEEIVVELRSSIEREIKLKFDGAREYGIPQWNLLAARTLREILQEVEAGNKVNVDEKFSRLREGFTVFATAFHMRYDSLDRTVSAVLSTLLHVNADPSVNFALAVHVQPFFNNIVSVAVGLAALTPKQ